MQVNNEHLEKTLGVRVELSVSIRSVGSVGEPSAGILGSTSNYLTLAGQARA